MFTKKKLVGQMHARKYKTVIDWDAVFGVGLALFFLFVILAVANG